MWYCGRNNAVLWTACIVLACRLPTHTPRVSDIEFKSTPSSKRDADQTPTIIIIVHSFCLAKIRVFRMLIRSDIFLQRREGGLQKIILFLCTTTHVTSFAATRLCLVTRVTKNHLATSLCGRHQNFGCYVGNKLVASHARMRLK